MNDPSAAPAAEGIESDAVKAAEAAFETAIENAEPPAPTRDYASIVMSWVFESLRNTPVAANTAAWNYLNATAVPDLIKRLQS